MKQQMTSEGTMARPPCLERVLAWCRGLSSSRRPPSPRTMSTHHLLTTLFSCLKCTTPHRPHRNICEGTSQSGAVA